MKNNDNDKFPDRDYQRLNIMVPTGFLKGDRIETIAIPRDQEHNSFHLERLMRRQLETPPMPEFFIIATVRMAATTFAVSTAQQIAKGTTDQSGIWVLGAFALCILVFLWIYCARAIATQPKLRGGVIYLWTCIAFGAVFGVLGGN
jgi:hypothetical protein